MASLLQKFVDADQWEAGDTVSRLGTVLHAAFLAAGFHPYGATPASGQHLLKREGEAGSRCLSRQYTAPQLARRDGADAAVLLLCAQGDDVALLMFLTSEHHLRHVYRERVDLATVAPLLSRALGDVEPRASRICRRLADGVCSGLFAKLCRRNGLALTGFMSLPDDVKVEILKKLDDGVDLARVECTCMQLRRLVAERDGELWMPLYKAMKAQNALQRLQYGSRWLFSIYLGSDSSDSDDEDDEQTSWKGKYVDARPPPSPLYNWSGIFRLLSLNFVPFTDYSSVSDLLQDPLEEEETATVSKWGFQNGTRALAPFIIGRWQETSSRSSDITPAPSTPHLLAIDGSTGDNWN